MAHINCLGWCAFGKPVQTHFSRGEGVCSSLPVGGRGLPPLQPERLRLGLQEGWVGARQAGIHGVERVTAREKLCEAWPGEAVQLEWQPVRNPSNPLLAAKATYED